MSNTLPNPPPTVTPRITGPRVFGCRPGNSLFFPISATGTGPLSYEIDSLPMGLHLNAKSGVLTGKLTAPGIYPLTVKVQGQEGTATRDLTLYCGSRIALTPPMGWNSWNCWGSTVSQENVLTSARVLASTLRAHGWSTLNIDDGWQGNRSPEAPHALQPNEKFPDMGALANEIHSLGLRFGIYSSPWVTTYAHFRGGSDENLNGQSPLPPKPKDWWETRAGFYQGQHSFAAADAAQWAAWGFDYLKYDWYPNDLAATVEIKNSLLASGRDIVLSLSNALPFSSVPDISPHAQLWRTTGDIVDQWDEHAKVPIAGQGIKDIIRYHQPFYSYQKPGFWNDPDMLVLGQVGWGKTLKPTRLTQDEQITHFVVWCLWSAPLLLGCPLDQLDDFTLSLLTNDDLIDINQDPRGVQAYPIRHDEDVIILRKPLFDGTCAFGLVNMSEQPREITLDWKTAELTETTYLVRDLVARRNLGEHTTSYTALVPSHGTVAIHCTLP